MVISAYTPAFISRLTKFHALQVLLLFLLRSGLSQPRSAGRSVAFVESRFLRGDLLSSSFCAQMDHLARGVAKKSLIRAALNNADDKGAGALACPNYPLSRTLFV